MATSTLYKKIGDVVMLADKRKLYDTYGKEGLTQGGGGGAAHFNFNFMSADDLFKQFFGEDFNMFGGSTFSDHPFFSKVTSTQPVIIVITLGDSPRAGQRQRSTQHSGGFFSGFPDMGFGDMGFSSFGGGGGMSFTSFRLVADHMLKMFIREIFGELPLLEKLCSGNAAIIFNSSTGVGGGMGNVRG